MLRVFRMKQYLGNILKTARSKQCIKFFYITQKLLMLFMMEKVL